MLIYALYFFIVELVKYIPDEPTSIITPVSEKIPVVHLTLIDFKVEWI